MKVILAGYNVDKKLLESCDEKAWPLLTPEVFSSAYAKISRSAKSVPELRKEALGNIEKARKLNEKIIFDFGHSSVAEHAVFNIDILGITRLALEYLESVKYASFTEKSQRYVTFGKDFYIPPVLKEKGLEKQIEKAFTKAFDNYNSIIKDVFDSTSRNFPEKEHRSLMQRIKEDARYILPLCTKTQAGMTVNARALEYMISFLCSQGIDELKDLSDQLLKITRDIAPSIIRYINPDMAYCLHHPDSIPAMGQKPGEKSKTVYRQSFPVLESLEVSPDLDIRILASRIFRTSRLTYRQACRLAGKLSREEKREIFDSIYRNLNFYHMMPKEYESCTAEFVCTVSASCFAQLKRHRESTIIPQDYSWENPVIIPAGILESKHSRMLFMDTVNTFRELYYKVEEACGGYKDYFMLNCNARRVLCRFDIKSLYNFFRLRSDNHSQWEIRYLSNEILESLKAGKYMAMELACGKDRFHLTKKEIVKEKGVKNNAED